MESESLYLKNARGVLRYRTTGRGPWVVLCHALGTDSSLWSDAVATLQKSRTVITFDLRGHGESSPALDHDYSFEAMADDVRDLLNRLQVDRTSLVGISVGGEVAQVFAARFPERLSRLVLCSTACVTDERRAALWERRIGEVAAQGMGPTASASVSRWFTPSFRAFNSATVEEFRRRLAAMDPAVYTAIARTIQQMDLRPMIRALTCPTLVVYGDQDENTGLQAAAAIKAAISGAQVVGVAGAAHFPNLEAPDHFNHLLIAGLSSQEMF